MQRSAYPGEKTRISPKPASRLRHRMVPLTGFALFNGFVSLPDLNALGSAPAMKLVAAAFKSSVHVQVSVDGLPSNVNFSSPGEGIP